MIEDGISDFEKALGTVGSTTAMFLFSLMHCPNATNAGASSSRCLFSKHKMYSPFLSNSLIFRARANVSGVTLSKSSHWEFWAATWCPILIMEATSLGLYVSSSLEKRTGRLLSNAGGGTWRLTGFPNDRVVRLWTRVSCSIEKMRIACFIVVQSRP